MAKKTIKVIIDDSSELKPTPMMSIPVPYDAASPYVGNSVFASVVFETRNGLHYYYRARKDVPAGTPLSNTEYWEPISGLERVGIYEAFINHLFTDEAFIDKLTTNKAFIEKLKAKHVNILDKDGYPLFVFSGGEAKGVLGVFEVSNEQIKSNNGYVIISPHDIVVQNDNVETPSVFKSYIDLGFKNFSQSLPAYGRCMEVVNAKEDSSAAAVLSKSRGGPAMLIPKGNITGLRLHTKVVINNYRLTAIDTLILVNQDGLHLYLPDNAEDGQLYIIRNRRGCSYTMHGRILKDGSETVSEDRTTGVLEIRYVYIADERLWLMSAARCS